MRSVLRTGNWRYVALAGTVVGGLVLALIALGGPNPHPARQQPSDQAASQQPHDQAGKGGTACAHGPGLSFVATDTSREQIYFLDARRASPAVQVVDLPGIVSDPAWSPDGRRVAFRWYQRGRPAPDVYVANADGSHLRLLVKEAAMPDWSPDGRLIAFANLHIGSRGISVVNVAQALREVDATRVVTRTDDDVPEELPAWSPDGELIAFTSQRGGNSDIWTVAVDGSHLRNLTTEEFALESDPSWSPDGAHIAFGSNRASSSKWGGDIYVMGTDGRDVRRITFDDSAYAPAWSPDGCGIAFNSGMSGTSQIYVMRPDGSDIEQLTTSRPDAHGDPTIACCPAWVVSD